MRCAGLVLLVLVLTSCGDERTGQRYRAERELWRADQQREELRSRGAGDAALTALAARYETVGRRFELDAIADSAAAAVQEVAGRAWLEAVDVHLARVDSLRAVAILDQMHGPYAAIPTIAAEVAWRRGRIARAYGDRPLAIELYRKAARTLEPDPGAESAADSVHHLPLEALELARGIREGPELSEIDSWAQEYYLDHLDADSLDVRLDARRLLSETHMERGRWDEAIEQLTELERELLSHDEQDEALPRYEPASIRLRRFEARVGGWLESTESLDSLRAWFERLRDDYEDYGVAPPALWVMAKAAGERGLTEDALRLLSQLRLRYGNAPILAEAMLQRARLLEREGRWREAYVEYRLLATERPLSGPGLQVPLEIADHHRGREDQLATREALLRAEEHYRGIIDRYPPSPHTILARERLVETLERLGLDDLALEEILELSRRAAGRPRELRLLRRAARLAESSLADPVLSRQILDRIVQRYPSTRIGQWAAQRLGRPEVLDPGR